MTSKRLGGSPLASLISQWSQQPSSTRSSYRILFQSNMSLATRIQTAESVENPQVYRRAGLRTPIETATRDFMGSPAWLVRIMELGVQASCHVILIRTQTRGSFLPLRLSQKITILDASVDPWGWNEEDETDIGSSLSLNDLVALVTAIRNQAEAMDEGYPIMLVWESLTPLLQVHGLNRTLRLLQTLDTASTSSKFLQVWSIRAETLKPIQHAHLEDAAEALLSLKGGEMTLMRQGIRETGNIVRERLPFQLMPMEEEALDGSIQVIYSVEEESAEVSSEKDTANTAEADASKLVGEATQQIHSLALGRNETQTQGESGTRTEGLSKRSKIRLRLEEDEEGSTRNKAESKINRPRIYLQDDDPEFDDMDDEDPDDDLDI